MSSDELVVSVVIPAYNCADSLPAALNSVFSQTFLDYEVIVVNDGSPDTPRLRSALAPYLGRIRYIQHENRGPSGARNSGIRRARGRYIAFLDGDDLWLPQHLENQVRLLTGDPELGLVYANPMLLERNVPLGAGFSMVPQTSPVTFESLALETSRISTSSVVASREQILRAGLFDESLRRCEDFDLWLRLAHQGCRIAFSPEVQLFHHRANGLASNRLAMKRSLLQVFTKTRELLPLTMVQRRIVAQKLSMIEAEYHVELARAALLNKNYTEAVAAAERANDVLDNWKLRVALKGLRTAPGLVHQSYRAYEQLLDVRNRRKTAKLHRSVPALNNESSIARLSA